MTYQTLPIQRIEGLNQDEDPTALKPGELSIALNAYRRGELVGTRPGVTGLGAGTDYENAVDEGNAIRGACEYRQDYDQGRRLITIAEHSSGDHVFYEDGARLTVPGGVTITAASDYIYSLALHNNLLWGTGGPPGKTSATTESIWSWDGNVANPLVVRTLTDKGTAATLRAKFIKEKWGYLLLNGLQGGTVASNNPACTRFHTFGSDPTNDANWTDGNTIGFTATRIGGLGSFGADFCTGFGDYQDNDGEFLMILGNRGIAAVQRDTQFGNEFVTVDSIATGCVHERAFVNLGLDAGDAIYMSERGFHSLRQSQQFGGTDSKFLSWKIRPFFESLNRSRIHYTCGAYAPRLGGILFACTTGTETSHNQLMWLDVKDGLSLTADNARWYGPWVLGGSIRVNHVAYLRDENNQHQLYLFTTSGRALVLSEESFQDLTAGYTTQLVTKHEDFQSTLLEKRIGDTMAVMATPIGGYAITHRTIFDFGARASQSQSVELAANAGSTIGSAVVGTAIVGSDFLVQAKKIASRGRGHTIAHEFAHASANQPFYITRLDRQIAGAGEDAGATD